MKTVIGEPYFICDSHCYLTVLIEAQEGMVTQLTRFSKSQQSYIKAKVTNGFSKAAIVWLLFCFEGIILFV